MAYPTLAQLRDVHLPSPISVWPLAPAWWILLGVFCMILILIIVRTTYLTQYQRAALKQLKQLKKIEQAQFMSELSCLLRRVALTCYPREQVATKKGMAWLHFLNETGKTELFTSDAGLRLITAPYQLNPQVDIDLFMTMVTAWIKKQRRIQKRGRRISSLQKIFLRG